MKKLLLFSVILLAVSGSAFAHDFSGAYRHPNVPPSKVVELDPLPQTNTFCASNLSCTVTGAWSLSNVSSLTVSGAGTFTAPATFSGSPSIKLFATAPDTANLYGFNLAYPTFAHTPPNGSTAVHQFDWFCAPDTDNVFGCGPVLTAFNSSGNDRTNFTIRSAYHPGVFDYNAGQGSNITSISRAGAGCPGAQPCIVTVNTSTQVDLRPTQGDLNISGVTGCATSPNGHFNGASAPTVVSATQFTFPQLGAVETCNPNTGFAQAAGRVTFGWVRNDSSNNPCITWFAQSDVVGDKSDQWALLQMPCAGGLSNASGFGRLVFNAITNANTGIGTTEQGFLEGNTTSYGLWRINSNQNDSTGLAALSFRNFNANRETIITGQGSNANGTWDLTFNAFPGGGTRLPTSNGFYRWLMDGSGTVFVSASDGGAFIPLASQGGFTPATAGGVLGTAALPFNSFHIGTAATNNLTEIAAAMTGARTLNFPDWGAYGLATQQQPATVVLHTAYTNATTTFSTLGDGTRTVSFPVAANVDYAVSCKLLYQGSVTTAGPKVQVTGPSTPTAVMLSVDGGTNATAYADAGAAAFSTAVTAFGTLGAATTNFTLHVEVGVSNGANAGTVTLQLAANGAGTLTVQPGSFCVIQ